MYHASAGQSTFIAYGRIPCRLIVAAIIRIVRVARCDLRRRRFGRRGEATTVKVNTKKYSDSF